LKVGSLLGKHPTKCIFPRLIHGGIFVIKKDEEQKI